MGEIEGALSEQGIIFFSMEQEKKHKLLTVFCLHHRILALFTE
jgi:hypothetical protein